MEIQKTTNDQYILICSPEEVRLFAVSVGIALPDAIDRGTFQLAPKKRFNNLSQIYHDLCSLLPDDYLTTDGIEWRNREWFKEKNGTDKT